MHAPVEPGIGGNLPIHRRAGHKTANRAAKKSPKRVRNHAMKKRRRGL